MNITEEKEQQKLDFGLQCLMTIAACYGYGNDAEYNQASLRAESVADLTRQLVDFCRTGRC